MESFELSFNSAIKVSPYHAYYPMLFLVHDFQASLSLFSFFCDMSHIPPLSAALYPSGPEINGFRLDQSVPARLWPAS